MNKEEINFEEIIKKIKDLSLDVEKIKPFADLKEVKPAGKSGHIILPRNMIGQEVLVIKFPKRKKN